MPAASPAPLQKRIKSIKAQKPNLRDEVAKALRQPNISETARQAAQDAQLDRTLVYVSAEAYADFLARLDAPPAPNERLKKTMQTKAPWEYSELGFTLSPSPNERRTLMVTLADLQAAS